MKIRCIVNPWAGKGRTRQVWNGLEKTLVNSFPQLDVVFTQERGHATVLAKEATTSGYNLVVAVGGDGTIHEVTNGLAGSETALAVIPAGTGNDLVRSLLIPNDPLEAAALISQGKIIKIDLGLVNDKYFINMAGLGFDAAVAQRINAKKLYGGTIAYLWAILCTLFTYQALDLEITIDGEVRREKVTLIAIANAQYVGGGLKMAPYADLRDGLLDVCIIKEATRWEILQTLPSLFTGGHKDHEKCIMLKAREVMLKPLNPRQKFFCHAEGEIFAGFPLHFCIVPAALRIVVPPEYNNSSFHE